MRHEECHIAIETVALVILGCILGMSSAARSSAAQAAAPGTQPGPPRLDMLRDAQICPDGRGNYYLTGTAATLDKSGRRDFDHNRGVPLWRSRDLKTWENLGFAWDRVEHFERSRGRPKLGVWLEWSAPAGRIDGLLAQAATTPEQPRSLEAVTQGAGTLVLDWKAPAAGSGGVVRTYVVERREQPAGGGAFGDWQQAGIAI